MHVFVECDFAQNGWEYVGLDLSLDWNKSTSWKKWLCILKELSSDALYLSMTVLLHYGRHDVI